MPYAPCSVLNALQSFFPLIPSNSVERLDLRTSSEPQSNSSSTGLAAGRQGSGSFACKGFETTELLAKQEGRSKVSWQNLENSLDEFL